MMRRIALFAIFFGLSVPLLISTPSYAQAPRTWVSGVGDDVNPCSRTAPCKTFAGAISKTAIDGEINCLDPAGFGAVTITKSITIDCTGTFGSILASFTTGININVPVGANDPFRTVKLRGLSISGIGLSGSVGTRTGIRGINILSAAVVEIDDVLITDFTQQGILDGRTIAGAKLFIRNSVIRNNTGNGITAGSTGGANATIIDNVHSINNAFGIAWTTGNNVSIARSIFSGNTTGVEADAGATMNVDGTVINHNTTGVQGVSGNIRISSSSVSNNSTGFSGSATTFGNDRFFGNSSLGTAPTATALQ
jgi:hypothetical protein